MALALGSDNGTPIGSDNGTPIGDETIVMTAVSDLKQANQANSTHLSSCAVFAH